MTQPAPTPTTAIHPLDPLSLQEIQQTCDLLRQHVDGADRLRFAQVFLHEPPKRGVLEQPSSLEAVRMLPQI